MGDRQICSKLCKFYPHPYAYYYLNSLQRYPLRSPFDLRITEKHRAYSQAVEAPWDGLKETITLAALFPFQGFWWSSCPGDSGCEPHLKNLEAASRRREKRRQFPGRGRYRGQYVGVESVVVE